MIDMLKQMCQTQFKKSAASNEPEKVQEQLSLPLAKLRSQSVKSQSQSTLSNRLLSKPSYKKESDPKECLRRQLGSTENGESQKNRCLLHNKDLQIYCLTDKIKVCPHCALFSIHRQHQLRPVKQVTGNIRSCLQEFRQTTQRKQALDAKLKSADFRQTMIAKITAHKNSLIAEIKLKFKQLLQNIKVAEKRAFDDVATSFKTIAKRITALDKQQQHNNLLYQKWELICSHLLQTTSFDQKAYLLAAGGLNVLKEGSSFIKTMEQKADKKIQSIQQIVKTIKVQQNQAVPNSIFNYLNIIVEQQQNPHKKVESQQSASQQQQEIIQFKSVKIIKEVTSSLSHSRKRGYSSTQLSTGGANRKSINHKSCKLQLVTPIQLQNIINEFCCRQNLETLDLSNSSLLNSQIYQILDYIKSKKKIKTLKLARNKLTSEGFTRLLDMIPFVTNLNLSFNQLADESVYELLRRRHKVPNLRIVNLSNNSINQRRCQNTIEQLKKQGIIVTI